MAHRSVSQVTTLERCGESYRLQKIARAPQRPAAWTHQGTAVHAAVEHWEGNLRQVSPVESMALLFDTYDQLIEKDRADWPDEKDWMTGGRTKAVDDIVRRRARAGEQFSGYVQYSLAAPEKPWEYMAGEAACELPFELQLGDVKVVGYIDELMIWPDGQITVRDLKSGTKRPDSAFQLGVYALGVESIFGMKPTYGDFFMLKDGKPDAFVELSTWSDRDRLTRIFNNADQRIVNNLFNPNPGDACRVCAVQQFCDVLGSRAGEYPAGGVHDE